MGRDLSYSGLQKYENLSKKYHYDPLFNGSYGSIGGFIGKTIGGTILKGLSRSGNEKSLPLLRSFFSQAVAEQNAREATKWVRRQKLYETSSEVLGEEVSDINSNNQRGNLYD
jgi:hypothetical protein